MSASNKKKLRREQDAVKLTERQLSAQKEAKTTRLYTIGFIAVLSILLVVAIVVGVNQTVTNSGLREKNSVALTVGDHKINSVEMNYFYMDAINNFNAQYGSYAALFGFDTTKPLNEQVVNEETGATWADDFLTSAKSSAQTTYAMADAAQAAGFALSEAELLDLDYQIQMLSTYAAAYGYTDADSYLKSVYGNGADAESYGEYLKLGALANAYYASYAESLTYEDAAIRAAEAEAPEKYNSYSFHSYYMPVSSFRTGGTTDADGNTTYSDEENAAAAAAAEAAAKSLTAKEITTPAEFDAAIAALSINEGSTASSTANTNVLHSNLSAVYSQWLTDSARKEGDIAYFPNSSDNVSGYYAVYYLGSTDNTFALANVRHILLTPVHGENDSHPEGETYSAEELAAAKAKAEEVLAQWNEGDKTEESFAELAKTNSSDGNASEGGLYENVYPGQMVAAFNDWCFDESRKAGDTGIVETQYGYHVMYYSGDSDLTYRDFQIENELRSADLNVWFTETVAAAAMTDGETKYIHMDLVLNPVQ